MIRNTCTICKTYPLEDFYKVSNFPVLTLPTNEDIRNDEIHDIVYGICPTCYCVQLVNLVDPSKLYDYPNKSSLTPLWKEHHKNFVAFIESQSLSLETISELGGANNSLYQYFKNKIKYTIVDLHEPDIKEKDISYTIGNIENFHNYTSSTILLSHTFEHLYNPHSFLKHIERSIVENIFISVPNMQKLLKHKNSVSIVFSEHTFYFEPHDIIYMLSIYGFICKEQKEFQDHSTFFYFKRDRNLQIPLNIKEEAKTLFIDHFFGKEERIRSISIDTPFYIMPSHYIGQMVYHYNDCKKNLLGFLDNDTNKCDKRLYGTNCKTHLPSSERIANKTVLLIANPYKEEMKAQLKSICPSVIIIECQL
jgi:hypothetical protein